MPFNKATFASLEFLLLVLGNAANWVAVLAGSYNGDQAALLSAASVAVYAVARGLAKVNVDGKPYWETTEFWLALVGSVPAVVEAFRGEIPSATYTRIQAGIAAAVAIASGLRKIPSVQAKVDLPADSVDPVLVDELDPALDGNDQAAAS